MTIKVMYACVLTFAD